MVNSRIGRAHMEDHKAIHGRNFMRCSRGAIRGEDNEFQHSHAMMEPTPWTTPFGKLHKIRNEQINDPKSYSRTRGLRDRCRSRM